MRRIVLVVALGLLAFPAMAADKLVLPPPPFEVERTRSDPDRPARPHAKRYKGEIHDTHVHLDPQHPGEPATDLDEILAVALKNDVTRLSVMPTPNEGRMGKEGSGAKQRVKLREKSQGSGVQVDVRCASDYLSVWMDEDSKPSKDSADKKFARLEADLSGGICRGVGEFGLFHFQKWGHQAVIDYAPRFEGFLRMAVIVADHDMWLDLHAETVEPKGKSREDEVFGLVDLLFQRHPDLKLILAHTAMTNPKNAEALLRAYPNLMFNLKLVTDHSKWRNLEPICNEQGELYEDWAQLMEAMPDRFMIGTDAKFGRPRSPTRKYRKAIKGVRKALGSLGIDAARMIAWDNAERVF
ncbi:MAG: amidohydrolase family protein [Rhodospirillales bacterium]|nr:amidohydrolase family protein [Rhodospirillales bacterium]